MTFTNAHVIAKQFKNPWIKGGIYAIGVIPGLSRIYEDANWASDVFLSWALSYFVVESIDKYLDRKYDSKYNKVNPAYVNYNLTFNGQSLGVRLSF